jgi:hypothetical protein
MQQDALESYLNDHVAGSVAAIELLDHLVESSEDRGRKQFFEEIRTDVNEDQETLRGILRALGAEESGFRKAGAWLTEKVGRLKLQLEGAVRGSLHELEALEALALGVLGKLALWRALAVAGGIEALRGVDLGELQRRAETQHARIESRRLDLAGKLFAAAA